METICQLLIEKGMDVGAASIDGVTALIAAASEGHADIVELLLSRANADPNARDKVGHWATTSYASLHRQRNQKSYRSRREPRLVASAVIG